MKHLAVFASGNGTNAQNLIEYFNGCKSAEISSGSNPKTATDACVKVVICNKPGAYVLTRAENLGIPSMVLNKEGLTTAPQKLLQVLAEFKIDYIILAGYLLKIPQELIALYPNRIINIHPALLPLYSGKGMYGHHVHEAVVAAGEKESGITIHLVDEIYDNGKIIFQAKCSVDPADTADDLAKKIHLLEQEYFPQVVENYISSSRLSTT